MGIQQNRVLTVYHTTQESNMKNTNTIIARYVGLSKAVTAAERSGDLVEEQKAMDRFWAFVDKYLYDIDINLIREADRHNRLKFTAFC